MEQQRLLLLSSSRVYGGEYLEYSLPELRAFLGGARRITFIPYALADRAEYAAWVRTSFQGIGYGLDSLHEARDARETLSRSEVVFCGGGNTFRLLKTLEDLELIEVLRGLIGDGMPYLGSSAGSNLACPTIMTTNDMPIVQPRSLAALGLVPFQINPHYIDSDPASTHMGESRERRIQEFHEENTTPVVGLREGGMLRVQDGHLLLKGIAGARIFTQGNPPAEVSPIADLSALLG